ncbi:response regulator transcription factor [Paraconexibacter sp. AEG42_29]
MTLPEPPASHAARSINVVLCDDVPALRGLMRAVLEEHEGVRVVGEAGNGADVLPLVEELRPDIVLLDLAMPRVDGLQATPRIIAASPGTRVIGLSGFSSEQVADQMLAAGAAAYLEKGVDLDVIVATVVRVATEAPASRPG